jgi:hypothetical protein
LIGSFLGDGHLKTTGENTSRYIVVQSAKKPLYFNYLYTCFKEWIPGNVYTRVYAPQNGESSSIRFATRRSKIFVPYTQAFSIDKIGSSDMKKSVPENIDKWLTPLSFAVWYIDDRSIKPAQSKGVFLNTHSFSIQDIDRLCEIVKDKFGIKAWKRPDPSAKHSHNMPSAKHSHNMPSAKHSYEVPGGYRIYISGTCYERLGELITPYFIDDIWYKWPPPRKRKL